MQANALFGIKQLRPVLLDHHTAEHVAEKPDVPSQPGVGAVGAQPAGSGVGSATIAAAAGVARACPCERPRWPCASVP